MENTTSSKEVMNCVPLLASILGKKLGVKVEVGGDDAYTTGNIIHLPSLPLDATENVLINLRGYIDHESAHIRFSDFDYLRHNHLDEITKFVYNSIEDWRVEQKLSEIYSGCAVNFDKLIRKLFIKEWKPVKQNITDNILEYILLTVRSWTVPAVKNKLKDTIELLDIVFSGLRAEIDAVLEQVHQDCPDTETSVMYAREIEDIINRYSQNYQTEKDSTPPPVNKQQENSQPKNPQNHGGDNANNGECGDSSSAFQGNSNEIQKSDAPEKEDKVQAMQSIAKQNMNGKTITELLNEELESSNSAFNKGLGEMIGDKLKKISCKNSVKVSMSKEVKMSCEVTDISESQEAMSYSAGLRSRIAGLLQSFCRKIGMTSRSRGKVCSKSLYRLAINDNRVFTAYSEEKGLNTAVHILLDNSYSMNYNDKAVIARKACHSIAFALQNIKGINPAITGFPAEDEYSVFSILKHGERLKNYKTYSPNGNTPLASALLKVMNDMLPLKETRKIILILTDGEVKSEPVRLIINKAYKLGFEVYGIGIGQESIFDILPNSSKVINNLEELTPVMFSLMQKALMIPLKQTI